MAELERMYAAAVGLEQLRCGSGDGMQRQRIFSVKRNMPPIQGYLAQKKPPPPRIAMNPQA